MIKILCFIALAVTIASPNFASAKVFRNSYLSFELPDNWKCKLENTEWVCRAESDKESKEAIMILTAKEVGPTDTIDLYEGHLNAPLKTSYKGAAGGVSKVVYPPKKVKISDLLWVDGLHMGSEVPNYFTRYLATIKDKIAILYTCSAHKDFYSKYSPDFFKAVQSLRVIATSNLLAKPELGPIRPGNETLGAPLGNAMPSDLFGTEAQGEDLGSGDNSKTTYLILGILLAAIGGYIFIKKRKGNS